MRGGLVNLKGLEVHPASGANLYSLTAPPRLQLWLEKGSPGSPGLSSPCAAAVS